jgi:hypothetical protein
MCKRTAEIKENFKYYKDPMSSVDSLNSDIRGLLENMDDGKNSEIINILIEKNREAYSDIFNKKFKIYREQADILESTCMGDDGYYFIKTSEMKDLIENYNNDVIKYIKFLNLELLPEIEKMDTVKDSIENEVTTMIDFKNGEKSKVYKFKQGEIITLSISSDIFDEAHLHGYDLSAKISATERGVIKFVGTKSGRFPIELEKTGKEIGVIEIYPN